MAVILFDIDKTIFDTPKLFSEYYRPQLAELMDKTDQEVYQLIGQYQASLPKYTDFDPQQLAQFLAEKTGASLSDILQILLKPESFRQSIFPETVTTLSALQSRHTLGVFSEAKLNWQRQKLEFAQLTPFFDPKMVFIFHRKEEPEALAQLPAGAWIVDDNLSVIETLTSQKSLKPIWLNRQQHDSPLSNVVPTISSLTEVPELVAQ
jgi:FMN phosphatase YigB (HAD superfamily)